MAKSGATSSCHWLFGPPSSLLPRAHCSLLSSQQNRVLAVHSQLLTAARASPRVFPGTDRIRLVQNYSNYLFLVTHWETGVQLNPGFAPGQCLLHCLHHLQPPLPPHHSQDSPSSLFTFAHCSLLLGFHLLIGFKGTASLQFSPSLPCSVLGPDHEARESDCS